jgi:RHS repeat-associated protein
VKRHESLFLHTRYDAFNRRIGETVTNSAGTSTQWYVYDGQNVVLQLNAAGGVTERYLCGRAVDQVLAAENGSGVVSWLLADNQGSVRDVVQFIYGLTTNVDHISYSAYGQIAHESNASYNPGIGYTGQFWDAAAGMYYCQARWYDPSTGRYMSEDPTGFSAGDANLYRYVFNDPVNLVDPTGEVIGWGSVVPMLAMGANPNANTSGFLSEYRHYFYNDWISWIPALGNAIAAALTPGTPAQQAGAVLWKEKALIQGKGSSALAKKWLEMQSPLYPQQKEIQEQIAIAIALL